MEFDDIEPLFDEDDLEEFERNQVFNDREHEIDDETPLGHDIDQSGELID